MKKQHFLVLFLFLFCLSFALDAQNKYAVLITGDYAAKNLDIPREEQWNGGKNLDSRGMLEFWNDTYLLWELLQNKGFSQDNIYVLFADGNDFLSDNPRYQSPIGTRVTDYPATFTNVRNIFRGFKNGTFGMPILTEDDFLFVWTFDHGTHELDGHYGVLLFGDETLRDDTLSNWISNIQTHKTVFWMQQCHGGGFASSLETENTVFHSACQANELAYRADDYTIDSVNFVENDTLMSHQYYHGEFDYLNQFIPKSKELFTTDTDKAIASLPRTNNRDYPYWTDIVTQQPEGYVELESGDVEISSAEGLAWLISVVNGLNGCDPDDFDGKKVELINDVDLSEGEWTPIGDAMTNPIHAFKGVFIGNRKAINNLYIHDKTYSKQYLGIFGYLDHAEVHDVFLYNGLIWGGKYCAGIVGWSDNGTLIDNCVVNLSVGADFYLGGIVGLNRNSIIRNCCYIHDGFMAWDTYSGGIAGRNEAEGQNAIVENCYFDSKIDGTLNTCYPGGVVGLNNTTGIEGNAIVKNCYAALRGGIWNGEGGIVGRNQLGEVSKCYFTLIDDYNNGDDISVIGDGDMNFSDCSVFTYHDGVGCMLENPVSIGENTTSDLLEALNLWLTIQDPIIQYNNWCEGETLPVFCNQSIGINETQPVVDTFVIYPNPTSGLVRIEGTTASEVRAYNAFGQLVKTFNETNEINLRGLPQGVYLLRITDENCAVMTKKLVVK